MRLGAGTHVQCCRIVSVLLDYPRPEHVAATREIAEAVARLAKSPQRTALERFMAYWQATPQADLAQHYVETIDFGKRTSLYLTHHLGGDTRARGPMLLKLRERYRTAGFEMGHEELPDFLPVVLEFAALAPKEGGRILSECRSALEVLIGELRAMDSPYRHLLDAVLAGLPRLTRRERDDALRLASSEPPFEHVGLDFVPASSLTQAAR